MVKITLILISLKMLHKFIDVCMYVWLIDSQAMESL